MANSITGNPWSLDTPGVITTGMVHIKNLNWLNAGAGALLIVDNAGRDIVRDTWASSPDHNYGELKWVSGLNLVTIGGGEVQIVIHK